MSGFGVWPSPRLDRSFGDPGGDHDTGPGIAQDRIGRVFNAFDRLGAEQTDIEGTGLGLAVSKRLIEAMQGEIGLERTGTDGCTFFLELPLAEGVSGGDEAAEAMAQSSPKSFDSLDAPRTVLYLEDNVSNFLLVEEILGRWAELNVLSAAEGGIGLALARSHRPDLIVLDLDLPDIPGQEVLRRLRHDSATVDIPVVVLSADATSTQIDALIEAGAVDYVTKPIDIRRFLEVVSRTLER